MKYIRLFFAILIIGLVLANLGMAAWDGYLTKDVHVEGTVYQKIYWAPRPSPLILNITMIIPPSYYNDQGVGSYTIVVNLTHKFSFWQVNWGDKNATIYCNNWYYRFYDYRYLYSKYQVGDHFDETIKKGNIQQPEGGNLSSMVWWGVLMAIVIGILSAIFGVLQKTMPKPPDRTNKNHSLELEGLNPKIDDLLENGGNTTVGGRP